MQKTCLNPGCRREYVPGHYGRRQRICQRPACRAWYRAHWRATRRPPRGLPKADYARLERAARPNPRLWALIVCARETGLRKGELLGLTWDDCTGGNGAFKSVVEVRGQWQDSLGFTPTKTRRSRLGLFSAAARKALATYRKALAAAPGAKLAGGARVWPVSEAWAWARWVGLQAALGIKSPDTGVPYRFHDLRHTLGCELARAGRLDLVREMLDHSRIETSMIYTVQAPEEVLSDVERIRKRGGGRGR